VEAWNLPLERHRIEARSSSPTAVHAAIQISWRDLCPDAENNYQGCSGYSYIGLADPPPTLKTGYLIPGGRMASPASSARPGEPEVLS